MHAQSDELSCTASALVSCSTLRRDRANVDGSVSAASGTLSGTTLSFVYQHINYMPSFSLFATDVYVAASAATWLWTSTISFSTLPLELRAH